jgi:hypothetical protein
MSLVDDLAYASDPVRWARERLGFEPDPWQARVMRSTSRQIALCCSRQSGKSQTVAAIAAHLLIFDTSRDPVVCVAPSQRQARELMLKVATYVKEMSPAPPLEEDNRLSMTLASGARILALPADARTVRGLSPKAVLIDESAFCPDDLYVSLRPMLAVTMGRLYLLSSPFGRRGFFFNVFDKAAPSWELIKVPASDCPRISPAFLAEELEALGSWRFRQEYQCEFVENVDSVFSYDQIMSAMSDDIKPLFDAQQQALIGGI